MKAVPLNDGNDHIIPLGKYKGLNIVEVYDNDPEYFKWMYDNCTMTPNFTQVLENMILTGVPF